MILDSIVLENVGTFRGKNEIKLTPTSSNKPVVLIGGLNGAGKTTILEAICGLRTVHSGRILINGVDVTCWTPADRNVGYMPQDLALFPSMTVREHIEFAMKVRNRPAKEMTDRVAELASLLQVQPISLGRLIDRMEAAGWVERRPAPNDRRAIQLYLTPRSGPILDEMTAAAALTREVALSGFDADECEQFFRMLERVKANLAGDDPLATAAELPEAARRSINR